jgi:cellulose synthase/poly-beta-1,6-N-acetylglucosamine synthase-like glycosyltransferase
MDVNSKNDERVRWLRNTGIHVLERESRGKRAGAINDALDQLKDFMPDYIAIFDVDSIPEKNFIKECVKSLEGNPQAYIASARRYISNPVNLVSRTIEAEYHILNFMLRKSDFKQFNGLIGVLRADILFKHRLNEEAITEDADFATRMHSLGYRALLVDGIRIYEQSPISWSDLINQRKRWYYGGLQLWRYWKLVKKSKNKKFILSWVMALTMTYVVIVLLPLMILSPVVISYYSVKKHRKISLLTSAGLVVHVMLLQYSALSAIFKFLSGKGVEWKSMKRVLQ